MVDRAGAEKPDEVDQTQIEHAIMLMNEALEILSHHSLNIAAANLASAIELAERTRK